MDHPNPTRRTPTDLWDMTYINKHVLWDRKHVNPSPHDRIHKNISTWEEQSFGKSSFVFVPCQLRPRSCLHAVVLYNKIGAGHTTFLLLITMCVSYQQFLQNRLAHSHTGCLWQSQNTASHRGSETSLFPRGPPAVPLTSRGEICLSSPLQILLIHASLLKLLCFLLQKGIYWTSQATICHMVSRWTLVCCSLKGLFAT